MNSEDPGIPEVLAALNIVTEEIRSLRQYTEETRKKGETESRELREWYAEKVDEQLRGYEEYTRNYNEQREEQTRVYDEHQRRYEEQWRRTALRRKFSWILAGWFFFVSIIFLRWLDQHP